MWIHSLNTYPENPVVLCIRWFFLLKTLHTNVIFKKQWLLMTKQQPVVTTRCGQQKQTRSTPMFVFEIRHSSLECLRLPVCLLLEPLLHGSSHSPYSTALLSETQSVLLEKWGQRELAFGQGCRSHWKRELVPVWRQLVSYQEIYSAREVHNTKFFFFFPLLPLLLLLIKKKTKQKMVVIFGTIQEVREKLLYSNF